MRMIQNSVGLAVVLGAAVACSGGTSPGPAYRELDDSQALPLGDGDVGEGGDAAQRPVTGDSALGASQGVVSETQAAPSSGQRPASDSSQSAPASAGGSVDVGDLEDEIADAFNSSDLGQLGITEAEFQQITSQCLGRCGSDFESDCGGGCLGVCIGLAVLECSQSPTEQFVACCDRSGDADECLDQVEDAINEAFVTTCNVAAIAEAQGSAGFDGEAL